MLDVYQRGVRTAIRVNATAFGYSILITVTLTILSKVIAKPTIPDLFALLAGGASGFSLSEALATGFFRHREREERAQVIILGSAFNLFSISSGAAIAWLVGTLTTSWWGWFLGAFSATVVYIALVGAEMSVALEAEDDEDEDDDEQDDEEASA